MAAKKKDIRDMTIEQFKSNLYRRFNKRTINILGTEYIIHLIPYGKTNRNDLDGACVASEKSIILIERFEEEWANAYIQFIANEIYEVLRHEIIHAFFNESGLMHNSLRYNEAWPKNEEMVDWLAIQFPKISAVYDELDINVIV